MRLACLALVATLIFGLPVSAQISDIVCMVGTEARNPVMGEEAQYFGVGALPDGWIISAWQWKYRLVSGTCQPAWNNGPVGNGGSPNATFFHLVPGTSELQLTANYFDFITLQPVPPPPTLVADDTHWQYTLQ